MTAFENRGNRASARLDAPMSPAERSRIELDDARRIFHSIIEQAFRDARLDPVLNSQLLSAKKRCQQERIARAKALIWLRGNHPDFHLVCELAGYEPGYICRKAREEFGDEIHAHQTI